MKPRTKPYTGFLATLLASLASIVISSAQTANAQLLSNYSISSLRVTTNVSDPGGGSILYSPDSVPLSGDYSYSKNGTYAATSISTAWNFDVSSNGATFTFTGSNSASSSSGNSQGSSGVILTANFDLTVATLITIEYNVTGYNENSDFRVAHFTLSYGVWSSTETGTIPAPSGSTFLLQPGQYGIVTYFSAFSQNGSPAQSASYDIKVSLSAAAVPEPGEWAVIFSIFCMLGIACREWRKRRRHHPTVA